MRFPQLFGFVIILITTAFLAARNLPSQTARALPVNQQPKILVLRGGLLIDGTGSVPLANSILVIAGDKIQSVGKEGSVTIPAGATVIDASGKTIIPGLFDSHVHLRNYHLSSYLYWGVTSVGDLGNQEGWLLASRDAVAKGRQIGPHIVTVGAKFNGPLKRDAEGNLIPGQPALSNGDMDGWETAEEGNGAESYVWDQASVAKAVAEHKKLGLDAIKLYTRVDPALMKLVVDEAHKNGLTVFAHYTSADLRQGLFTGTDEILDTGLDVHVHLYGLIKATASQDMVDRIAKGENLVNQAWATLDTSKFPPLVQKMVQVHMFLNPTINAPFGNATKFREVFDRLNTEYVNGPIVANLPEANRAKLAAAFKPPRGGNGGGEVGEGNTGANRIAPNAAEGYRRAGLFVKEFADAGGKVIAGSDTNGGANTQGLKFQEELQMLREVGLTPMQVIQAATSWGFEAWGKSKEVGTLEPGKRADVLILNRNPLDDMMATTDIYKEILSGSLVDREGLAHWQDTVPKPELVDDAIPNPSVHVPWVSKMFPELVTANAKGDPEMTLTGENFTKESMVLFNNRLFPAKSVTENQDKSGGAYELKVQIPPALLKSPGMYPVVVLNPGSGGAVSNMSFLIVEAP